MVRSITTRETEWDDTEQAWMLALHEYEGLVCSGCHGWLPETCEPDVQFRVPPPTRCHRCTAIAAAQEEHAKNSSYIEATRWTAERR